jgi:hypothetical protein
MERKISFIIRQTETDVLKLLFCTLDTIALKFAVRLYKLVALIFAVRFKIIIQQAVGNESFMKTLIIITALYNRSRKKYF